MTGRHHENPALRVTLKKAPVTTKALTVILTAHGLALILQPERWVAAPAFGLLTHFASPATWGIIYMVLAAGLFASIFTHHHTHNIIIHTLIVILLGIWCYVFTVRWATNPHTTLIEPINWSALIFLAARSATADRAPQ